MWNKDFRKDIYIYLTKSYLSNFIYLMNILLTVNVMTHNMCLSVTQEKNRFNAGSFFSGFSGFQ